MQVGYVQILQGFAWPLLLDGVEHSDRMAPSLSFSWRSHSTLKLCRWFSIPPACLSGCRRSSAPSLTRIFTSDSPAAPTTSWAWTWSQRESRTSSNSSKFNSPTWASSDLRQGDNYCSIYCYCLIWTKLSTIYNNHFLYFMIWTKHY